LRLKLFSEAHASTSVPSPWNAHPRASQGANLREHAGEERARNVVRQQPSEVARQGRMLEARLVHFHIDEPEEREVVVELLAQHPFAS
jgi:hypothetical protein